MGVGGAKTAVSFVISRSSIVGQVWGEERARFIVAFSTRSLLTVGSVPFSFVYGVCGVFAMSDIGFLLLCGDGDRKSVAEEEVIMTYSRVLGVSTLRVSFFVMSFWWLSVVGLTVF